MNSFCILRDAPDADGHGICKWFTQTFGQPQTEPNGVGGGWIRMGWNICIGTVALSIHRSPANGHDPHGPDEFRLMAFTGKIMFNFRGHIFYHAIVVLATVLGFKPFFSVGDSFLYFSGRGRMTIAQLPRAHPKRFILCPELFGHSGRVGFLMRNVGLRGIVAFWGNFMVFWRGFENDRGPNRDREFW